MTRDTSLRTGGWVALGCFLVYAMTAPRTIGFGDSPELIAAIDCLGVAHPPGYPLYTLLGWLVLRLPFGEPAFRLNLLSAAFGALTVGCVAWLIQRRTGSRSGALTAALVFAFSSTFWYVSIIAEVYALHMFYVVALIAATSVHGFSDEPIVRRRALYAAALTLGLGLAHHPTIVLALPAAVALGYRQPARRTGADELQPVQLLIAGLIVVAVPLMLYPTLIWRARLQPPTNWGRVIDVDALIAHASAMSFRHLDLGWANLLRSSPWNYLGGLLRGEFGLLVPLAAVAGLVPWSAAMRKGYATRLRLALVLLILPAMLFGMRYDVEDVQVFYLPVFLGLALAAGLGIASLAARADRRARIAGGVLGVALVGFTLLQNLPSRSLAQMTAARDYAEDLLATVPQDGLLFVRSMESFGLLYLTQVLGQRPDVTIFHRNGNVFVDPLSKFGVRAEPAESPLAYRIRVEQAIVDTELRSRRPRAVMFLGWPGYATPERYRTEPVGLLHAVRLVGAISVDTEWLWDRYRTSQVAEQARKLRDPLALSLAATYPIARGERSFYSLDPASAQLEFERAEELSNHDARILSYIGTVYGRYGDLNRAIEVLESAVARRPSLYEAWNNLAMARELVDDLEGARAALRRSLEIAPAQVSVASALSRLEAAR